MWAKRRKSAVSISLSLLMTLAAFSSICHIPQIVKADNDPIQPPEGGTVEVIGQWTVNDIREYHNCTIIMSGNLVISGTGSLTFHNVTLVMNNTYELQYYIQISGQFEVLDWDNNKSTEYDRSIITSPGDKLGYQIFTNGGLSIWNSYIEFGGGSEDLDWFPLIEPTGGGNIHIEGNYFQDCYRIIHAELAGDGVKFINNTVNKCEAIATEVADNWYVYGNIFQNKRIDVWAGSSYINLNWGSGHIIENNKLTSNYWGRGIELWNIENSLVKGNDVSAIGEYAISIVGGMGYDCSHNTIIENNITNNYIGIYLYSYNGGTTHNNTIQNNSILGNLDYAIRVSGGPNKNNDASYNYYGTENQTIIDTLVKGDINHSNPLPFRESNVQFVNTTEIWSNNVSLSGGVIVNSDLIINSAQVIFNSSGPQFIQVNGKLSVNNSMFSSTYSNYSIAYVYSSKGDIHNSLFQKQVGIGIRTNNFTLSNTTLQYGFFGILADSVSNITIRNGCNISYNRVPILLESVTNGFLFNLTIIEKCEELKIQYCEFITLDNIRLFRADYYHHGGVLMRYSENNSVINSTFIQTDPFGGQYLFYSTKGKWNNVSNCIFINGENGADFYFEEYSVIQNCTFIGCEAGMWISDAENCTIENNECYGGEVGIRLTHNTYYNNIYNNNVYNNTEEGISLWQADVAFNNIENNTIRNNNIGCFLWNKIHDNIIKNNNFIENTMGIKIENWLVPVDNNLIYHNNFIHNIFHAYYDTHSNNLWDNGYPSGGNFWSDYSGPDDFSGPNQDIPGSDGIGDEPYDKILSSTDIDNYPLMSPIISHLDPLLYLKKEGPIGGGIGENITYFLNYTNYGKDMAVNVVLTEIYPESVTFVSAIPPPTAGNNEWDLGIIPSGGSGSIIVIVQIDNNASGLIRNCASIAYENFIGIPMWPSTDSAVTMVYEGVVSPHPVIRINSNADFDAAHGIVNWATGDGSPGNPWIIENYVIFGTELEFCIYVGNTTDYFVVRNCYLTDASGDITLPYYPSAGLCFINVENGLVENNIIYQNERSGCYIYYSSYNTFSNNIINSNSRTGVFLYYSSNNILNNNNIDHNMKYGIQIMSYSSFNTLIKNTVNHNFIDGLIINDHSNSNVILDNRINFNTVQGIRLDDFSNSNTINNNIANSNGRQGLLIYISSSNNQVNNNTINFNQQHGILISADSNLNNITNNNITMNSMHGLYLYSTSDNLICDNSIVLNNQYGLYITLSSSNTIYHNDILENTNQAFDDGNNFWNASYPTGGNYWSDYNGIDIYSGPNQDLAGSDGIGDTNYSNIEGGVNVDNYPLMSPINYGLPTFVLPLSEGWNLISFPLIPFDESIDDILQTIAGKWDYILAYDPLSPEPWKSTFTFRPDRLNDLVKLNHKMGFWINITEPDVNLTVGGYIPSSTSINLFAGWNLVGYPSLTNETVANALWGTGADQVMVCDTSEPYHIKEVGPTYVMKPGEGYWVHVPFDTVWVVDW